MGEAGTVTTLLLGVDSTWEMGRLVVALWGEYVGHGGTSEGGVRGLSPGVDE